MTTPDFEALAAEIDFALVQGSPGHDASDDGREILAAALKAQYLAGLARAEALAEEHIDSSSRTRYVYALRAEAAKIAGTA